MASKAKFFSWSKGRNSSTEPYHRTGGLLAIDTSVGDASVAEASRRTSSANHAKKAPKSGRRRPPNLTIIPPEYDKSHHAPCLQSPPAHYNAALSNSASNLLAVFNDMLRSPPLTTTAYARSASVHKPLPSRPRSWSVPSSPDLPAELPGSLLLENQGFPDPPVAGPADRSTMRSARSGNSLRTSVAPKPSPSRVPHHKKSLSEASLQRPSRTRSRPNLVATPSSTDSKLTTYSVSSANGGHNSGSDSTQARVGVDRLQQPSPLIWEGQSWNRHSAESSTHRDELGVPGTPTTTHSRQADELKATITVQDNTISTLQAQFASLRASHEAHIASLADAHALEVASLRNYSRALEEQQSQRTLHHASSNSLLFLLETTELQSPTRENSQSTAGSTSANSVRSFNTALEQQQARLPLNSRDSPEMENLKRKLSTARRPETGNRDTIRELNQYKQNNAALQKQIESLMAKLNESKKKERDMSQTIGQIEKGAADRKEASGKVEQLEKNNAALQNTIDHLEYRLEVANCDKLDAHEQLFLLRSQKSPFESKLPTLHVPPALAHDEQSAHMSMSTVFSSGSPNTSYSGSQEPTTLAAFISRIERLQEEIKQKDARNSELEADIERLQQSHSQIELELKELNLQSDIQAQLLKKTRDSDAHIDQLRTIVMDREATIGEKEKSLRMAERQLDHHKLLLKGEIRRHATMSLYADGKDNLLPELSSLTTKEDIDRWIERLQSRLKKESPKMAAKEAVGDLQTTVDDLRKEIDFYVREIIYYKLDIKGYKSDIKKLKHIATRLGNYGGRTSDFGESPTPSFSRSGDTPIRARFPSGTSGLGISNTPSPISTGPISATVSVGRPITPPPAAMMTPDPSPADPLKLHYEQPKGDNGFSRRVIQTPMTPQTPTRKAGVNLANEADSFDPGISPRSVARLSPERRKPTPPSPSQERLGQLATNFPLNTPAAPKRHDTQRSNSESTLQMYTTPRTPEWSPGSNRRRGYGAEEKKVIDIRGRNLSTGGLECGNSTLVGSIRDRMTPERPTRPRQGLFETPTGAGLPPSSNLRTPPRMDVMAEAMRNSPSRNQSEVTTSLEHRHSSSSLSEQRANPAIPPPLNLRPRIGSASSGRANIADKTRSSPQPSISTPFVIGMGSPYNTALIVPSASVSPTTCSITGKTAPLKIQSPTSKTGVDGTMATSSSPAQHPSTPVSRKEKDAGPPPSASAIRPSTASSRTSGHSRNTSGSSIRSAIQLPVNLMRNKSKTKKESISHPTPLASPFDIDRSAHLMNGGGGSSGFGIGEAI